MTHFTLSLDVNTFQKISVNNQWQNRWSYHLLKSYDFFFRNYQRIQRNIWINFITTNNTYVYRNIKKKKHCKQYANTCKSKKRLVDFVETAVNQSYDTIHTLDYTYCITSLTQNIFKILETVDNRISWCSEWDPLEKRTQTST